MKLNLTNLIVVTFLAIVLAHVLFPFNSALADTVKSNARDTLRQAAKEVVKDTGAKEIFGKSEKGEQLIDNAKQKANKKLKNLVKKADSETEIPDSEKLFLENLSGES